MTAWLLKHADLTSYFHIAHYWRTWGFHRLAIKKGTEAVGCFHPQGSFADGNGRKKGWARKVQIADKSGRWGKLDMGREWPRCLPVLTSCLPRKCQSEIFRKECWHGNLNWLFPSQGQVPSCAPAVPMSGGRGQSLWGFRCIMENPEPTMSVTTEPTTACGKESNPECSGACSWTN